jgi:hypothetical protein
MTDLGILCIQLNLINSPFIENLTGICQFELGNALKQQEIKLILHKDAMIKTPLQYLTIQFLNCTLGV